MTDNKLLTGFAAGVCVLLLLGAAATTTRYVGNFLGNVGSATNSAGCLFGVRSHLDA